MAVQALRDRLNGPGIDILCKDGNAYHLRAIRPEDADAVMRGYDALDDEDKWFRVLHTLPHLTVEMAKRFASPDPNTVAIVVEGRGDLAGELVGSARIADIGPGRDAEFSVTVRPEVEGLGLAKNALATVIDAAREAGCRTVWGSISVHNTGMLGLARRLGFKIEHDPDDRALMKAVLPLP